MPQPQAISDPQSASTQSPVGRSPGAIGLGLGFAAYGLWGVLPVYFPLLKPAGPFEIIAHRVIWSVILCLIILAITGGLVDFWRLARTPRILGRLALTSGLVLVNWTVYVYAINSGHVLDTSLGYFINPIVTILLAVMVLHERLRRVQWVAVGISGAAVVVMAIGIGRLPWISLALAGSWALYSLLKNRLPGVGALPGLTLETLIAVPIALAYLATLGTSPARQTFLLGPSHAALLAALGVVTAVPLLLFNGAARRLPLSVTGMIQYVSPIAQFLLGLLYFHEAMPASRWAGFALVWVASVILALDGVHEARKPALTPPAGSALPSR